jgi:hypothetical protein
MKKQCRCQEKHKERGGSTFESFDAADTLFFHYPQDAKKILSRVFRKLDFRTTKAGASFIAGEDFFSRQTLQFHEA